MRSTISLFVLYCPSLFGCATFDCLRAARSEPVCSLSVETVFIGGLVNIPSEVKIGSGIETLSDGLAFVGTQESSSAATSIDLPLDRFAKLAQQQIDSVDAARAFATRCQQEIPVGQPVMPLTEGGDDDEPTEPILPGDLLRNKLDDLRIGKTGMRTLSSAAGDRGLKVTNGGALDAKIDDLVRALGDIQSHLQETSSPELYSALFVKLDEIKQFCRDLTNGTDLPKQSVQLASSSTHLIVSLNRNGKSYLMPLDFVTSGFGGAIRLISGDLVLVKEASDSALFIPTPASRKGILIQGMVRRPGNYRASEMGLSEFVNSDNGLLQFRGRKDQMCIVLERRSVDGISVDTYLLPATIAESDGYSQVKLVSRDEAVFMPYFQIPLIAESLAGKVHPARDVSRVDYLERRTPVLSHHEETLKATSDKSRDIVKHAGNTFHKVFPWF